MPATNQWAVSTLIREVLADPDLAHDDVFRRLPPGRAAGPGRRRGRRRDRRAALRRAPRSAPTAATARGPRRWPPPPGRSKPAIPKLRTGSFFPSLLHPRRRVDKARMRGGLLRAGSRACPRAGPGDLVRALGNESGISRSTVSRIRDGHRRGRARVPRPVAGPHLVPLLVRGRHVPGREGGAPGGLPGAGGGHRRVGPRAPEGSWAWPWATPRPPISGPPCLAVPARARPQGPLTPRPRGRGPGLPVTPTPASAPRSGPSCPGRPGSAAAPRFARNITTQARLGPHPSRRAPWSPRSSPPPAGRPSWPSTSTSSTP